MVEAITLVTSNGTWHNAANNTDAKVNKAKLEGCYPSI